MCARYSVAPLRLVTLGGALVLHGLAMLLIWGPAAASSDWQSEVGEEIAAREYEITLQDQTVLPGLSGAWHAPNRAHNLRTYFTDAGIRVVPREESEPSWEWGLVLLRYGRLGGAMPVAGPFLSPSGNRIDYDRGEIVEWYVNDPRGLEQGFTLSAPPPLAEGEGEMNGAREVHIDLSLTGTLDPSFAADGQAIDFKGRDGAVVLRYAQLRVEDARGHELQARMEGFAEAGVRGIRLIFDDRDAVYPVTVDPLTTSPAWTAESDQGGAVFGYSVATAGDVNGDGYSDLIVGAYNYDNGQTDEGRAYLYLGSASGLATSPAWTAESNQAGAELGISVAAAGDVNDDGYSDVIVGVIGYDNGQTDEGRAHVYLGSASGLATSPAWTAESDQAVAHFGYRVATAGDVNGDDYSDVIVGAWLYDGGQTDEGRAYVYLGSASGLAASPAWTAESDQAVAYFGYWVATAGDVNGDGYSDVIVGAYAYENGQTDEGGAFVYHGSASGLAASPAWVGEGGQANAQYGVSVAAAGDVNGDGYSDVLVGADAFDNGHADEGRAYVYLGSTSGLAFAPVWTTESDQESALTGSSVATAGDVNGDGYSDVIVGAYVYDNGQADEGRAYVYLGSASGPAPTPVWTAEGDQAGAHFSFPVATAGDVNGDGYSDIAVGAFRFDNGETDEGRVYVYLGSASSLTAAPAWTAESNQAIANFGSPVATAGDVNGDGYSDVIVGARSYDNSTDEGRAYVYLGSASGLATTPGWTAEGDQASAFFGTVASAGDVNGDGYSDVVVGATGYDNGETDEGRAYVYLGSASGLAMTPAWTAEGDQASIQFGSSVATAGDVNGDGYSDVIVGNPLRAYLGSASGLATVPAWTAGNGRAATAGDVNGDGYSDVIVGDRLYDNGQTDEGRAWVYLGSATGLAATAAWTAESDQTNANFGSSVATAGDVNGDGYSDVIVGAAFYDNGQFDEGRAYVYLGSASGLAAAPAWTGESDQASAYFGTSVATAGDVNGDGYSDVIAGAYLYDNGQSNEGQAWVYLGSASGLAAAPAWTGESDQAEADFGISVATAGDVNGDGHSDVIVGAWFYDNGEANEGRAFVYYGNDGDGLDRIPRQARADGTAPIDLLGASDSETSFRLRALGRTPLGRGRVHLEMEVEPLGTDFDDGGLLQGAPVDTGAPVPGTGSSVPLDESVLGLTLGTPYHWRVRLVTDSAFFPRSPWLSLPYNNRTESDLRTASCVDLDGDGYGSPGSPVCPAGAATDCDDADFGINPGAAEICDGLDNDCDTQVDEDVPGGCACAIPGTGLVSWWPADGTAEDVRGGHDGALAGGMSYGAGQVGQAFSFDGSDDFVWSIGAPSTYSFIQNTGVFTIAAWMRLDDPTALVQHAITGNTQTTAENGHFFIWENSDGSQRLRVGLTNGTPGVAVIQSSSAAGAVTDSDWHHVAAVGDGTNVTFYVDGVGQVGTGTMGTLSTGDSTRLLFLGACGGACVYKGRIDEVVIYDQALDAAEVQAIYAAGGVVPAGSPALSMEYDPIFIGTDPLLLWTAVPAATGYDVVRGNLTTLRSMGGDFAAAVDQCIADDLASTSVTGPAPGNAVFFLVRAVNCTGNGSYGSGARDAGIAASGGACPE